MSLLNESVDAVIEVTATTTAQGGSGNDIVAAWQQCLEAAAAAGDASPRRASLLEKAK